MASTCGTPTWSMSLRAYGATDSKYRRCASAYRVPKASDDLPEPDTPVKTTRALRGITTSTFFRLCSRAPRTWMQPSAGSGSAVGAWRSVGDAGALADLEERVGLGMEGGRPAVAGPA